MLKLEQHSPANTFDKGEQPLQSAMAYVENFDFAVFPCHWINPDGSCSCGKADCERAGKHPLTEHGFKDATKEPTQILEWWKRWPQANVGIATGTTSGLVVLDVDPRHAGDEALAALEAKHGKLPDAPTVLTGGVACICISNTRVARSRAAPVGSALDSISGAITASI